MAWAYRHFINQSMNPADKIYISLENKAKTERVGLWLDDHPIEPYRFRLMRT